jgi:hypothetical protein
MNAYISFLVIMLFSGFNHVVHGQTNVILQILLNNGNAMTCGGKACCSNSEWDYVSHQIYTMSIQQRQLLRGNDDNGPLITISNATDVGTSDNGRRLPTYPAQCANSCAGYAKGRCFALNCMGYRRRTTTTTTTTMAKEWMSSRELFWATPCENQKSEVHNLLNNICVNNQVGANCKKLLSAPRKMTCFSNVKC